jgi:hypothetical protein
MPPKGKIPPQLKGYQFGKGGKLPAKTGVKKAAPMKRTGRRGKKS